jgi:hypothetical protein
MNSSSELANRFREVMLNGTWIANTNYQQQLASLGWEQATTKVASLNTIAVLAQHIHYYVAGVLNVLKGGTLDIKDQFSFDFPPIQSQKDWADFLLVFFKDADAFAYLVEQLPPQKLTEVFVAVQYGTYQRNIEGMIEHCYYHLGQIVLLNKLLASKNPAQS